MMAGNVESNPGSQGCTVCNKPLKTGHTPIRCTECANPVHNKCTGLTRAQLGRGVMYRCRVCVGSARGVPPPPPGVDGNCNRCRRPIRAGTTPVTCLNCRAPFHAACTTLTRRQKSQGTPYIYCCGACGGHEVGEVAKGMERQEPEACRVCAVCAATIRRGASPEQCAVCWALAHRICTGLPRRGATEGEGRWTCAQCGGNQIQQAKAGPLPSNKYCPKCQKNLSSSRNPMKYHRCQKRYYMK